MTIDIIFAIGVCYAYCYPQLSWFPRATIIERLVNEYKMARVMTTSVETLIICSLVSE